MIRQLLLLVPTVMVLGCGTNHQRPAEAVAAAPPAPVAAAEVIAHPDHSAWKRFKAGAMVKRRAVTERADNANKVIATEIYRLIEVSADRVIVERQKTVERVGEDARVDVSPSERWTTPAVFALPNGMTAADFQKPSPEAKSAGVEALKAAGKEYKCQVYKFSNPTEAGPMTITVWWSDDMPGRRVQQTMEVAANGTRTHEVVVEAVLP